MKSTFFVLALIFSFSGIATQEIQAQETVQDPMNKLIMEMAQTHQGKTLCLANPVQAQTIRANVSNYLRTTSPLNTVTSQTIMATIWTLYPCPFSPYRPELRPAKMPDIEGVWLFPESSQKLRFGPNSTKQSPAGRIPVKCDAVGYYPNGELRHAIIAGQTNCPFEKASDLDMARKNPRVSSWVLLRDGRISVTRTDVINHIEEWDVYTVIAPFSFHDVQFNSGDLIAYVRRENGNEVGAATQFRHLKRLF